MSLRLNSSSLAVMNCLRTMWLLLSVLVCQTAFTSAAASDLGQLPPPQWERIHAGNAFSFEAPTGTKVVPVRGIDSFVGAYQADGFSIGFDYGPWSNDLQGAPAWDAIDGHPAKYASGPSPDCMAFPGDQTRGTLEASVYVAPSRKIALSMGGCARDEKGLQALQRVFKSIRFGPN